MGSHMDEALFEGREVVFDFDRARAHVQGRAVPLTAKEVALLKYLADRAGEVVPRDELLVQVWGFPRPVRTRAVDNVVLRLRRKLGEDPSEPGVLRTEVGAGYRLVVRPSEPRKRSGAPPEAAGGAPPRGGTVPGPPRDFVGRREERAALARALETHVAAQIVGPGGVGKTAFLCDFLQRRALPVRFCDLSATASHEVLPTIVRAAGGWMDDQGEDGVERICAAVPEGCWLVLDNVEPVHEVVQALVEDLLDREGPRVLLTSRRELRVPGLWTLILGSLSSDAALQLFRERANGHADDWTVGQTRRLAELLGGQPLALELAASRTAVLDAETLIERATESLSVLGSSGTASDRHDSEAANLQWSWDLMPAEQREDLMALSVFSGTFCLEHAEAVLPARPGRCPLDRMQDLVVSSLVQRDAGGRLRLPHTLRLFAGAQLGDPEPVYRRLGRCSAALAESLVPELFGPDARRVIAALGAEQETFRALSRRAPDAIDRVWCGLAVNASLAQTEAPNGRRVLLERLAREEVPPSLAARVALERARLAELASDYPEAIRLAREALARPSAPADVRCYAEIVLGRAAFWRGDVEEASDYLRRAASVSGTGLGPHWSAVVSRATIEDWDEDELDDLECSLRRLGLSRHLTALLASRGARAQHQGRTLDAESCFRECVELAESLPCRPTLSRTRLSLADLYLGQGRFLDVQDLASRVARDAARFGWSWRAEAARCLLAAADLALGRIDEARDELWRLTSPGPIGMSSLARAGLTVLRAAACSEGGGLEDARRELERARRLYEEGRDLPRRYTGPVKAAIACGEDVLAAAEGGPEVAQRAFERWTPGPGAPEGAHGAELGVLRAVLGRMRRQA